MQEATGEKLSTFYLKQSISMANLPGIVSLNHSFVLTTYFDPVVLYLKVEYLVKITACLKGPFPAEIRILRAVRSSFRIFL